jgi:lipopolysaccharide biosynthesis glycosyltransferase
MAECLPNMGKKISIMDKIHVAFVSDRNYLHFVHIALASLLSHHPDGNLEITLIHSDLNDHDFCKFAPLQKIGPFDLKPIQIDKETFHEQWGVSKVIFFRLALPSLRPYLRKIIYLDCDLVVLDDIAKLWEYPLDGKTLAAVGDRAGKKVEQFINVPAVRYFNSGVMIMNLDKMRANNAEKFMQRTYREQKDYILFQDQDILNICYNNDFQLLPQKWNIINSVYRNLPVPGMYNNEEVIAALQEPGIAHFTGSHKPWLFWKTTHHPYAHCFWHYALMAPIPWQTKFKFICKRLITGSFKDSSVKRPWDKSILKKDFS